MSHAAHACNKTLTFIEMAIIELTSCINNPSMNTVITLFFKESYKYVKKITDYYYYFKKYKHFFAA